MWFPWGVGFGVGDAVAAAEVEFAKLNAVGFFDPRLEAQQATGRFFEACGFKDLRSDVTVQADQLDVLGVQGLSHRLRSCREVGAGPWRHREPEFLVFVRSRNELVRRGVNAWCESQHDRRSGASTVGDLVDAFDLFE